MASYTILFSIMATSIKAISKAGAINAKRIKGAANLWKFLLGLLWIGGLGIGIFSGYAWYFIAGGFLIWSAILVLIYLEIELQHTKCGILFDILSSQESIRVYLKDLILIQSLENDDLSDRKEKDHRDVVDELITQFDTAEGLAALSLMLKRKNYTNYNPDGERRVID